MLCEDRKRETAICQYPIQPTIFSYPTTKTAFVPYILEQLAIIAEQQAASVLWHMVKWKQKEKKQWEDIGKWLETGKSLSTDLGLDPRSSIALGWVDLWFGLLLAGMQNSASFPCSRYPANRHWNHLQPNWFSMSLCICVFMLPSDWCWELQQFAAYNWRRSSQLQGRRIAVSSSQATVAFTGLAVISYCEWSRGPQMPLQCCLCLSITGGCARHAGWRQVETPEKQPLQSLWVRKSHVAPAGIDDGPVDTT